MAMNATTDRPRIFSHLTRTRFLHIEDSLERGKLRFFIGSFEKGKGSSSTAYAFLDVEDARVIFSDMAWGKPVEFNDFKGGRDGSGVLISRVLKIDTKAGMPREAAAVWVEVQNGPGQELGEGAVKPDGLPSSVISIPLKVFEARKMAFACLAYMQAWEAARLVREPGPPAKQDELSKW
jgi:hypothetical protein